jgi:serine/threonine protein kinase
LQVDATVRYEKLHEIGIGQGMNSKVYLATDAQFSGNIAVKEIPKATFGNTITDYYREAERMFAASHPNVVPVHYAGETGNLICIAMPYFSAGSLATRIAGGPVRLREVVRIAQGVLSGLTKVHNSGLLHFDIKPCNVLFDDRGSPLLADFGQCRHVGTAGVVAVPSMYFRAMPPETLLTGTGGVHSDIYQAGLLLYRMSNGDPHYQAQVSQISIANLEKLITKGRFPDRSTFQPHIPSRLRTIIRKALRVNPSERYSSAFDLSDDLARLQLTLDWAVTASPSGLVEWQTLGAAGHANLIIRRVPTGLNSWNVEVFTEKGGKRRAKNRSNFWKRNISEVEAGMHLDCLFSVL